MYLDYLEGEDPSSRFKPMINKFIFNGSEYLKITPRGFVVVDITSYMDKKEGVGPNTYFTLGKMDIFYFINAISKLGRVFANPNIPLFRKDGDNNELVVNNQLAEEYSVKLRAQGNKIISMVPAVIEQDMVQYEGICLYINSLDNFSYLTISELLYFLYELRKIDINNLTLLCVIAYHQLDNKRLDKVELPKLAPLIEEKEDEVKDNKKVIRIEENHELPDI